MMKTAPTEKRCDMKMMSLPVTMERGSPVVQLCSCINFVNF